MASSSRLTKFDFNTRHLPRAEQFEVWRALTAPLVNICPGDDGCGGFAAEQVTWDLRSLAFTKSRVPAMTYSRTAHHLKIDPLDHWIMTYTKSGSATTHGAGTVSCTAPGTLQFGSLRGEFEGVTSKSEMLYLIIPRDFCREAAGALDAVDNMTLTSGLSRLLADYLLDLERRLDMLTAEELPGLLATTRAMIIACVAPSADRLAEAQKPIEATLLERARQMVQENLLSPTFGSDELCRELGVSRSKLYRLFEPVGGVVHYIRCRRLLDAHVALSNANDDRRIVDIAAERGFVDAAEFSRAFKREFGYRPRDARGVTPFRAVQGRAGVASGESGAAFGALLRRLQHRAT